MWDDTEIVPYDDFVDLQKFLGSFVNSLSLALLDSSLKREPNRCHEVTGDWRMRSIRAIRESPLQYKE